ncbi:MAG: YciI family protein [Chloroflexota bacterium]
MRVIVLAKSSPESEGVMPDPQSTESTEGMEGMEAMGRFHEELVAAGVLLATGRLHPSSAGARVRFDGSSRTVVDGPFTEAKELVAGYWIWQVRSLDEGIEWLKRAPFDGGEFEIRQIFEMPGYMESAP